MVLRKIEINLENGEWAGAENAEWRQKRRTTQKKILNDLKNAEQCKKTQNDVKNAERRKKTLNDVKKTLNDVKKRWTT